MGKKAIGFGLFAALWVGVLTIVFVTTSSNHSAQPYGLTGQPNGQVSTQK